METITGLDREVAVELEVLLGIIRSYPTVRSIILFGSTARGTRDGDSDIDLLVLVMIWAHPLLSTRHGFGKTLSGRYLSRLMSSWRL
jgi:predicted nucleotidyltransferase